MLVHGDNLAQKEKHPAKYQDKESRRYLSEIRVHYNQWKLANETLLGPMAQMSANDSDIIIQRVKLLNAYKDFLDQQHYAEKFDSRSNLHSSVLEEFIYYLFRDIVCDISRNALIGKCHSFKDIFFKSPSFKEMLNKPYVFVETKDHDFAIGVSIKSAISCHHSAESNEEYHWDIPAVAIECKTYLDKTMLQDVSTAAEQLKQRNPNAMYIVIAEWLKLSESINLRKYKIDQIYVLRKQKNTDREFRYETHYHKNPIFSDVVEHCFNTVRHYLTTDWNTGISHGIDRGFLL